MSQITHFVVYIYVVGSDVCVLHFLVPLRVETVLLGKHYSPPKIVLNQWSIWYQGKRPFPFESAWIDVFIQAVSFTRAIPLRNHFNALLYILNSHQLPFSVLAWCIGDITHNAFLNTDRDRLCVWLKQNFFCHRFTIYTYLLAKYWNVFKYGYLFVSLDHLKGKQTWWCVLCNLLKTSPAILERPIGAAALNGQWASMKCRARQFLFLYRQRQRNWKQFIGLVT